MFLTNVLRGNFVTYKIKVSIDKNRKSIFLEILILELFIFGILIFSEFLFLKNREP